MRRSIREYGMAVAALILMGAGATARGDLVTTVSETDGLSGGLYLYTYTLTNDATSDQLVNLFQVAVSPDAELQSIGNDLGWDFTYAPGATDILFTSAISPIDFSTNDLPTGASGVFTFASALAPIDQSFLIAGVDPAGGFGGTNSGLVAGPGARAVPEPASLVVLSIGLAGLLIGRRFARGGGSRSFLPLHPERKPS